MSRTAKIVSTAIATLALSFGSVGVVATTLHVDVAGTHNWCC